MSTFIHEIRAYELLEAAGLRSPRRGVVRTQKDVTALPFKPGERVVLKGAALDVWHKSDLGLVRFEAFDQARIWEIAQDLERTGSAQGGWIGTLVVEEVSFQKSSGLPTEALAALRKSPEAGWTVVVGLGGLHTNAWGEEIPPLLWPVGFTTPEQALAEFKAHYLGKIWLGALRQGKALTSEAKVLSFLNGLWKLVELLEREGATLLELNPVVLDAEGHPTALDGVGSTEEKSGAPLPGPLIPMEELFQVLVQPQSIAVAGISSTVGTPGHTILDNLRRSDLPTNAIRPIKPGHPEIDGLPCLNGVEDLAAHPVDILVLCLPAALTVQAIVQLCEQGGGAKAVFLVAGGVGDGADIEGHGHRVVELLREHRAKGLWTPALVGPNSLGFLSSSGALNTLFLPEIKLPFMTTGGTLSLVSQSGAFLVTRLSNAPKLSLRYGVSIGNQLDVRLSHFIRVLGRDVQTRVIACYAEGFQPGDLLETAQAAHEVTQQGKWVVLYKGGRSEAGQAAASSHTGALAGDWELQKALLKRAGVIVAESVGQYDAALSWLSIYPEGKPSCVAVLTNAGYESVVSADRLVAPLQGHVLEAALVDELKAALVENRLQELVAAHLPLDLTPMADEKSYLDCLRIVLRSAADTVVVGMVPLALRLETWEESRMKAFAHELAAVTRESGKRVGLVAEGGAARFEPFRQGLIKAGLPVFLSMESALNGLELLAAR